MSKIGFIGLGIMGHPMAGHLQAGGHELFLVQHSSPLPQDLLDNGAIACASAKEVAQKMKEDGGIHVLPAEVMRLCRSKGFGSYS